MDLSQAIKAKSDQLNADDLIGGSIIVKVVEVNRGTAEQPVSIKITGGHQPWKPAKTVLRVLCAVWGMNSTDWVGKVVELYNDESVKWAGKSVGGIRIRSMEGVQGSRTFMLAVTRGKKSPITVTELKPIDNAEDFAKLSKDDKLKHWGYLDDDLKATIKASLNK